MITSSIVIHNTKIDVLKRILCNLLDSCIDIIYVIDNSPNDAFRDICHKYPRVIYIYSINLGYGSGHNIAIHQAIELNSKYHIVVNPDIYFDKRVIDELAYYMDETLDCGLVMPKILYPNGDIQYLCKLLPTPLDLFCRRFIPSRNYPNSRKIKFELRFTHYNKIMVVPLLSGCFMFMRVNILRQIGGFDERFFMYAEDFDLCRRIGKISKTIFYPKVSVFHEYEKGSYKNKKLLIYHIESIIKYFNKWGWFLDNERHSKNKITLRNLGYKKKLL